MIPTEPGASTTSEAERRLFARLRDDTPDDLLALHGVGWIRCAEGERPQEGEADFVLVHPARGALVLEVKGGGISFDPQGGRWTSRGREGDRPIKDPFAQAQTSCHRLVEMLRHARAGGRVVHVGYGVCLPDTRVAGDLRPEAPRSLVIDGDDLRSLWPRLEALFRHWRPTPPGPGRAGVALVESLLAQPVALRARRALAAADEERELLRLTEQQHGLLDLLARRPRAAIEGCAGSGKTMLAAEKARRLAAGGARVLVVCFNILLAEHLRRTVPASDAIDVFAYDELCSAVLAEVGQPVTPPKLGGEACHFAALHRSFADAIDVVAGRYDALVVDEGQDIQEDWWLPLQLLLAHPDDSPLYVFYDEGQRLFGGDARLPDIGPSYPLSVNCRSTRRIAEALAPFRADAPPAVAGPEGSAVEVATFASPAAMLGQIARKVRGWIDEDGFRPEDIALLTPRGPARSTLSGVAELAGVPLTDDPWQPGAVLRTTIHRFKGLERPVVAVCEADPSRPNVLYTGCSRARSVLAVFCCEEVAADLPVTLRPGREGERPA